MEIGRLRGQVWPSAVLAAVFALAVNLPNLGRPAPWRDEAGTWVANQRSLRELVSMLGQTEAVHGLYYLLMRAWQWVFPDSIVSLRMVSTIAVAVTAGLLVVLGTAMFGLGIGRWAGLVYGLLPQATWAAGEARSYALSAAAVTLAFVALWLALSGDSWLPWLGYAAAVTFSVHLFLYSALAFLAVVPLLLVFQRRQRSRLAVATGLAALASFIRANCDSFNGYEAQPKCVDYAAANYLDYIWVSKGVKVPEWETVIKADSAGRFLGTIPSDHNMLRATTTLP